MTFLPSKRSESDVAKHYSRNIKEPTYIEYIGDKATLGCIRQIIVGSRVYSISLSSNRNHLLSGSPSGTYLWDVDNGELVKGPFGGDASISFSYFGNRTVVVNGDGIVEEWDADIGERLHVLPTVDIGRITSVAANFQGYYAIGSENGAIQLLDRREKTTIGKPLMGHSGKVLALSFSGLRPRYLASGSEDQSIIIWNVWRQEKKYASLKGHSGPITSVVFTVGRENLVSGSLDRTVRLWDVSTGNMLHTFSASGMGGVYSVASFMSGGHILSGSEDGMIRMWDTRHREMSPKKFIGHTGKVISLSVKFTDRGRRFASGSSDGTIRVWDVAIDEGSVEAIAASPNGEYLVSGSLTGTVSILRIETGELIKGPLKGHNERVTSLSFLSDGDHFASGSYDGTVIIWNLTDGSVTWSSKQQSVWANCFSPDGNHVASGTGNTIRVWDSKTGELSLNPLEGHLKLVNSVCYSPDGKRIVSGSRDKTACIWNASNGTLLLTLQGHSDAITSVTYSHDGSYILSGSRDGTIRVWNASDGKPVHEPFKAHEENVISVCFSPDDTCFISTSWDKTVRVWNISTRELLFKANVSSVIRSVVILPSSDSKYIRFASVSWDRLIRIWRVNINSRERIWNAPNNEGWVIGNDGNLLFWLPLNIRPTFIGGPCIHILNSRLSTMLALSKYQGSQWTSCFSPSTII